MSSDRFDGVDSIFWPPRQLDLDDPLAELARLAQRAVPGCDGAGMTSMDGDTPICRASNRFAKSVDDVQYRLGQGPCVEAVEHSRTVVSGTINSGESRWPLFDQQVRPLPIRSALSIPLIVDRQVIGSINLYGRRGQAFTEESIAIAEQFAQPAATSLFAARLVVAALDACDFGGLALADRAVTETAVGLLMGRHGVSPAEADVLLRDMAVGSGATHKAMADRLIGDAYQSPEDR